MSHEHTDHPDLVGLLRGEVGTADILSAEDHLRDCAGCRDDLLVTVTGHALLGRAASALGDVDLLPAPPLRRRLPLRRPRLPLIAAAAAILVAGVGIGVSGVFLAGSEEPGPQPPSAGGLTAVLTPVDEVGAGEVQMADAGDHSTQMTVRTTGLPAAPAGGFYYAWLLDPDTDKMLPLGLVGPTGSATFRIDGSLVASYSAIDISLETDDGDPGHSVTSVLRGTYGA